VALEQQLRGLSLLGGLRPQPCVRPTDGWVGGHLYLALGLGVTAFPSKSRSIVPLRPRVDNNLPARELFQPP